MTFNADPLNPVAWNLFALSAPRGDATNAHIAAAWLARRVPEYWVRAALNSLAQRGPDRLSHDIVSVGHRYAGDLLEIGADGLADLHLKATLGSIEAADARQAEDGLATQLLELRQLIRDVGRERRRQGVLRASAD